MLNDGHALSLCLSDMYLTHDGYPLSAPDWATPEGAWEGVLRDMQLMRQRSGDFKPVRVPDVSTWFSRTCRSCSGGFRSRAASGRYCSNRCDPRGRARAQALAQAPEEAAQTPAAAEPQRLLVRRRRTAESSGIRCDHCLVPSPVARPPGRWFCSMRCARQARARATVGISRRA